MLLWLAALQISDIVIFNCVTIHKVETGYLKYIKSRGEGGGNAPPSPARLGIVLVQWYIKSARCTEKNLR